MYSLDVIWRSEYMASLAALGKFIVLVHVLGLFGTFVTSLHCEIICEPSMFEIRDSVMAKTGEFNRNAELGDEGRVGTA